MTRNTITKVIYIKFGELVLKGKNRYQFSTLLLKNIKKALFDFKKLIFIYKYDAILIKNIPAKSFDKIFGIVKMIPGIRLVIEANIILRNRIKLCSFLSKKLPKKVSFTFKVRTKRIDKKYPINSLEFDRVIGNFILKKYSNAKVDVHQPQILINIEINDKYFIIYWNKQKGLGGFPLGINGRVLVLISGGIDSPVASHLLMKRGFHVDFLTFISPPHTTTKSLSKTINLIKKITLSKRIEQKPILYICNFTPLQHEIAHISNHSYQITIMRRYFFRIGQYLAKLYNYSAIATGENLGQVASQTIESITTISNVIKDTIVLRPLLTYDKEEIITIAKKIGSFEISILPYPDACSSFVPTNPVTKPKITIAEKLEKEMIMIKSIYEKTIKEIIKKEI